MDPTPGAPDPLETRRRGTRRVRALTAALGGAALVGTGVVTVVVASEPASATVTDATTDATTGTTDSTTGGTTDGSATDGGTDDSPWATGGLGGPPSGGLGQAPDDSGSDASSGAS